MTLDDFLAHGQPDAGAGILLACVQPLEDDENAVEVFALDSDPIIAHGKKPLEAWPFSLNRALRADRNMNLTRPLGASKFKRVVDKILKELHQLRAVRH